MHRLNKITNHLCSTHNNTRLTTKKTSSGCPSCPAPYNKPVKVLVTGAAGNIAYSILFGIGRGKLLGPNQKIELYLLDIPMSCNGIKRLFISITNKNYSNY